MAGTDQASATGGATLRVASSAHESVAAVVRRVWGFDSLRPLQGESIAATLAGRDSLTVLPTGGGKSLCYQAPAVARGRLTLVVSPLIALMQDQVAGLRLAGVSAAAINSHAGESERAEARELVRRGELRILLVAPERLLMSEFLSWVGRAGVAHVAIDEAHCISQWGHDFRPEYRRLAGLRDALPGVPIGAYTATATPRVQRDIVAQLRLRDPAVMVGCFDRPNLTYRILPRVNLMRQITEALARHEGSAAIIYCISRKDTEAVAGVLKQSGIDAAAYHAGMTPERRTRVSERFRAERLRVVVATVAFGMGIDRGDVRCVIHAAMPKSLEHYQQETGRAGRDGLPAECLMLYSGADPARWRSVMDRSAAEANAAGTFDETALAAQFALLEQMHRFATATRCRHAAISAYFGQEYPARVGEESGRAGWREDPTRSVGVPEQDEPTRSVGPPAEESVRGCGACDVCLSELAEVPDSQDTARKILSCVFRCGQSFGAAHVADVLLGKATARIKQRGHDQLSTFGLLRRVRREQLLAYIGQLIDAGHLERTEGEYPIVRLTGTSAAVLRNEARVALVEPAAARRPVGDAAPGQNRPMGSTRSDGPVAGPLSPEDHRLFESLRQWRRTEAERLRVPPYVVFSDATLQEIARLRPRSPEDLLSVRGIGQRKLADFGPSVLEVLRAFEAEAG